MDEAEKIKLKSDAIWKARDNEVAAVRERTLIVWGFLLFCYGGYGFLVHSVLQCRGMTDARFSGFNLALLFLALVCTRLSVYWIQMAKGAKSWAENFDFIADGFQHRFFKNDNRYVSCPFRTEMERQSGKVPSSVFIHKNCAGCDGDPSYACVFSVIDPRSGYCPDVDENILTSKGGAFSPAAVMVSIARLSLMVSSLLCCLHIAIAFAGKSGAIRFVKTVANNYDYCIAISFLLVFVFWLIPVIGLVFRSVKSQCELQENSISDKKSKHKWKWFSNAIYHSSNVSLGLRNNQLIRTSYSTRKES